MRTLITAEHELDPGDPTSVSRGRSFVTDAFTAMSVDGSESSAVLDDAVLAVSELVTNAVVAAHARICLTVELRGGLARIAVYDDGPGLAVARASTPDRPHGRGISIVEIVSSRWGVSQQPPGKWVWAEFPVAVPAS